MVSWATENRVRIYFFLQLSLWISWALCYGNTCDLIFKGQPLIFWSFPVSWRSWQTGSWWGEGRCPLCTSMDYEFCMVSQCLLTLVYSNLIITCNAGWLLFHTNDRLREIKTMRPKVAHNFFFAIRRTWVPRSVIPTSLICLPFPKLQFCKLWIGILQNILIYFQKSVPF